MRRHPVVLVLPALRRRRHTYSYSRLPSPGFCSWRMPSRRLRAPPPLPFARARRDRSAPNGIPALGRHYGARFAARCTRAPGTARRPSTPVVRFAGRPAACVDSSAAAFAAPHVISPWDDILLSSRADDSYWRSRGETPLLRASGPRRSTASESSSNAVVNPPSCSCRAPRGCRGRTARHPSASPRSPALSRNSPRSTRSSTTSPRLAGARRTVRGPTWAESCTASTRTCSAPPSAATRRCTSSAGSREHLRPSSARRRSRSASSSTAFRDAGVPRWRNVSRQLIASAGPILPFDESAAEALRTAARRAGARRAACRRTRPSHRRDRPLTRRRRS